MQSYADHVDDLLLLKSDYRQTHAKHSDDTWSTEVDYKHWLTTHDIFSFHYRIIRDYFKSSLLTVCRLRFYCNAIYHNHKAVSNERFLNYYFNLEDKNCTFP